MPEVRRRTLAGPTAIACVLSVALASWVVLLARWGPDWPAQEFRAWIALHDGLTTWTSRWYGGTSLPGYSILYPALGAAFGAGLVGIVSVVVASWAAMAMAPATPLRSTIFAVSVAVALTQNLLIGQVPYLLGVAFGAVALRMLLTARTVTTWCVIAVLALGCSLASPLAGASLLLVVPAFVVLIGRRALVLTTTLLGIAVSTALGGAGGFFPFDSKSLAGLLLFCVGGLVFGRPLPRPLKVFLIGYCVVALAFFFVPTAVGGNIARLGKLIAVPLTVRFLPVGRGLVRKTLAGALLTAAAIWPSIAFTSSIAHGAEDPSQQQSYYTGLLAFLRTQDPLRGRLEIPFTREHWEAMWVATSFPIARGWERQTDLAHNAVLYHPLTAATYRQWLADNAVDLVALPDVSTDYGGKAEAHLLAHPPAYLSVVWRDAHWTVWRVRQATPLLTGAQARLTELHSDSASLTFATTGTAVLRVRADRLWHVAKGSACLAAPDNGWLHVVALRPGRVVLSAGIGTHLLGGSTRCSAGTVTSRP